MVAAKNAAEEQSLELGADLLEKLRQQSYY